MDKASIPTILSAVLLVFAGLCYKEAMTPPNPRLDKTQKTKYDFQVSRLVPRKVAIPICRGLNYLVLAHFALEVYCFWKLVGEKTVNDQNLGISTYFCPSMGPSTIQNIYPDRKIPSISIVPLSLIIAGAFIRISCHRELGRFFIWDTAILKGHQLITTGCYGIVRHPAYAGYFGLIYGYFWFLWTPGTFGKECIIGPSFPHISGIQNALGLGYTLFYLVIHTDVAVYIVRRSFREDEMLKREFGKQWEEWAARVRWNVFPYIL